ncbi:MAG: hypothetical protein KF866_06920 [Phycisphaeraceae bacterium]|nr:hypothetical protein [Phycisphaeraceae bacterium]MCW5755423.1 hypothetical protein [Phycisphaeraceae bacterium]
MPELPPDGAPDGGEISPDTPDTPIRPAPSDHTCRAEVLELERRLAEARAALALAENEREATRAELDRAQRRLDAAILLHQADAIDLAEALGHVEQALADAPPAVAVAELRERSPALFASMPGATSLPFFRSGDGVDHLREQARASGDRRILLRYLRARRGA